MSLEAKLAWAWFALLVVIGLTCGFVFGGWAFAGWFVGGVLFVITWLALCILMEEYL